MFFDEKIDKVFITTAAKHININDTELQSANAGLYAEFSIPNTTQQEMTR